MPIIETKACQCALCGYIWIPGAWRRESSELPVYCAGCKSARWNRQNESNTPLPVQPKVEPTILTQPEKSSNPYPCDTPKVSKRKPDSAKFMFPKDKWTRKTK
jgi:hypothetical protein